jgi:hypothetical protein
MDAMVEMLRTFIQHVNWQSPFSFVIIAVCLLALAGRWGSVLMVAATGILAAIAHNLIIMNIQTTQEIASVPAAIYCIGGIVIGVVFVVSFVRYMIS